MTTLFAALQAILPQHLLSRWIGRLAALENPVWLKNTLIKLFIRNYGIDLSEAEHTRPGDYRNFNHFFTRALAEGARPTGTTRYLQPADGELSQRGAIDAGTLLQAKGRWFSVQALLASDASEAGQFETGSYATIYLSPRDYHRVHMPISGSLRVARYVPGDLFAVNRTTVASVDQLFARNERLVCLFDTADGTVAVIFVGAIIVAGIETVWGGVEAPAPKHVRERRWTADEAPTFAAGDEIGRFFLGSTVVVLSPCSDLAWAAEAGDTVRVLAALAD